MRTSADNPQENAIPTGIDVQRLVEAVASSGYPLQGLVAKRLAADFSVVEERGYIDDETKEHRSLDVWGYRELARTTSLVPGVCLLIECKRSRQPYVFFRQVVDRAAPQFPAISRLPTRSVTIRAQNASNRSLEVRPELILGLEELPFVTKPPLCTTFSKAIPSGNKVDLSGSEPFNSLVLPLVKAFRHETTSPAPVDRTGLLLPTLTLCLAVVDGPLLLVETPESAADPILCPWVRVVRQEASSSHNGWTRMNYYALDVVHYAHLHTLVHTYLLPFAQEVAARLIQYEEVLRWGGEVPTFTDWKRSDIVALPSHRRGAA